MPKLRIDELDDGEPTTVYLSKPKGERTQQGKIFLQCCDCGLEHLLLMNVRKESVILRLFRTKS